MIFATVGNWCLRKFWSGIQSLLCSRKRQSHIILWSAPFCRRGGGGGLSLWPNFQKGGKLDMISVFRGGWLLEEGDFFCWGWGSCSLNWEILTNFAFKRWDGFKDENFLILVFTEKSDFQVGFTKNQYIVCSDATSQITPFSHEWVLRHSGVQWKTVVKQEVGKKIDSKR